MSTSDKSQRAIIYHALRTYLDAGEIFKHELSGTSMFPFLKDGDMADLCKIEASTLKIGDVLVFQSGDQLVVHRLIKFWEEHGQIVYQTKGDSCYQADRPFFVEDLIGIVVCVERKGRKINISQQKFKNKVIARISSYLPPVYKICRLFMRVLRKLRKLFSRSQ
jgi:signal peptidase I